MVGKITREVSKIKNKRFDADLKKDIAKLYISGNLSCASLADELGIHQNAVQYSDDPEQAFPSSGNLKPDEEEIRKAQCRIKDLETEVSALNQAVVTILR